jgi:hypothetical protein
VHDAADADFPRLGQSFEAGGDVDAVAEDVAFVEDDVAEVDADTKLDPLLRPHVGVALGHRLLQLGGTAHRIDDAGELHEQPVAGRLYDPAPMLLDLRVPHLGADRFQRNERAFLVRPHQPRIPGDIGGQDRGEAASGGHYRCGPSLPGKFSGRIPRLAS